ncbi:MAG: DUF2723 domain-containing protein [Abditibacteriales bacterium]|nr:DUF2723 domain-containing protein [Abditibacteriales bacterium]MDW8366696.1 DUF2723 domain-containing protein [Abditibacteriales bacterium]
MPEASRSIPNGTEAGPPQGRTTSGGFLPPVLCGLIAFTVYFFTLAPTIAWGNFPIDALRRARIMPQIILSEDSAELSAAAATLGIAHPSGYPLFILVGHLFSRLPLGEDVAYRLNIFSALCAAVAVAFLWLVVHDWTGRARAAWLAALLFAFSYTFWEHALMTEVHALHLLLLTLALWCATRALRDDERRWLYGWAFVSGLGMSNHLTTILFLPGFIVLLFRPLVRTLRRARTAAALVGCYVAGLLPYLYLPLRAMQKPLYNWGNPSSLERWWKVVSGGEYRHFLLEGGREQVARGLQLFPLQLIVEFDWIGAALGALGFCWLILRVSGFGARETRDAQPTTLLALTLMGGAQLVFALCYHIPDPQAIYLPVYLVFAIALGIGWSVVEQSTDNAAVGWRVLRGVVFTALPLAPLLKEEPHVHDFLRRVEATYLPPRAQGLLLPRPRVSLRQHYMAARFAQGVLRALPPNTIYLSRGDGQTFSVWYYQRVYQRRPDVITVLQTLLRHAWYRQEVAERLPALATLPEKHSTPDIVQRLTRHPATRHRPIFFNVPPPDWQESSARASRATFDTHRLVPVPVPLPPVNAADSVTDDQAVLYRYAP